MFFKKDEKDALILKYKELQKINLIIKNEKEEIESKFFETISNLEKLETEFTKQIDINGKLAHKVKSFFSISGKIEEFQKQMDRNFEEITCLKEENFDLKSKLEEQISKNDFLLLQNKKLSHKIQTNQIS